MKVLFDTNVVLDVLLDRQPHVVDAARLFARVESGQIDGLLGATSLSTIFSIAAKDFDRQRARASVRDLIELFSVAPVDREVLTRALGIDFDDYEDAVLHESALAAGATVIVTRNGRDFTNATIPTMLPHELLAAIAAAE